MVITPGVLATCIHLLSLPNLTEIAIRTKSIEEEIVKDFSDFLKDRMCGVLMALVEQRQRQMTGKLIDVGKLWRGSRHGGYQLLQKAEVECQDKKDFK